MLDPSTLFEYETHVDARTIRSRILVVSLGSFVDAGRVQRLVDDHLVNSLTSHRIGHFDADQLMTYREQRPAIVFNSDEFISYATPSFDLHQVTDAQGENFLLLTGPEPGLQWERFAASIARLIERHEVELTVVVQGMPMPVPHTRPVMVTRWSNRPEILGANKPVFGTMQMHTPFPAMLSVRLGELDLDVIGLTSHVPHYLADADFPDGAIALVDALRRESGLDIPTLQLAVAAGVNRAQIGKEIEESEELQEHLRGLEEQYDEFHRQREIATAAEELPSADEIGAEAEDFLRNLGAPKREDEPFPPGFERIDPEPGEDS